MCMKTTTEIICHQSAGQSCGRRVVAAVLMLLACARLLHSEWVIEVGDLLQLNNFRVAADTERMMITMILDGIG